MSRKLRIEYPGAVVGMQQAVHPPQYCYARPPQWPCYGGWRGREGRMQNGRREYLDLTKARVRDEGKPRLTHAEVKQRYGIK